ncbi:hypothetical protein BV25DRAFT_1915296 [Artomyces pyxidatus]|uniref:Uncharacterized protein n=1 Tax=Artomyces pyxidatus TaxID=48021 RepID=A0ACB8T3Q2_9AGAM|nr:hypothetical protein BV25DRAFT_1915296 [Artomyces pyxidatus]
MAQDIPKIPDAELPYSFSWEAFSWEGVQAGSAWDEEGTYSCSPLDGFPESQGPGQIEHLSPEDACLSLSMPEFPIGNGADLGFFPYLMPEDTLLDSKVWQEDYPTLNTEVDQVDRLSLPPAINYLLSEEHITESLLYKDNEEPVDMYWQSLLQTAAVPSSPVLQSRPSSVAWNNLKMDAQGDVMPTSSRELDGKVNKRAKKACTVCREQKKRCVVPYGQNQPCSNCSSKGIQDLCKFPAESNRGRKSTRRWHEEVEVEEQNTAEQHSAEQPTVEKGYAVEYFQLTSTPLSLQLPPEY